MSTIVAAVLFFLPQTLERIEPDESTGSSRAVVVKEGALVYTAQLFPEPAAGDEREQTERVLDRLAETLREAGSDLNRAVRIHVYAARAEGLGVIRKVFARRFPGREKPAATFVAAALPVPGALVAADAVAAAASAEKSPGGKPRAAIVPEGPIVFVSGQAGNGEFAEATRKTLDSLQATLAHAGLTWADVVQIKTFLRPIGEVPRVEGEIKKWCGGAAPPLVFVEWKLETPIEIELVARGGKAIEGKEPLEYISPPGLKTSPVYSLVTRVNRGPIAFTSGLSGSGDPEAQVRETFASLRALLDTSGSDFRHLAKATYYITDEATSAKLLLVRKELYDPARPPGASKALVAGMGVGKSITLDMIAVCPSK